MRSPISTRTFTSFTTNSAVRILLEELDVLTNRLQIPAPFGLAAEYAHPIVSVITAKVILNGN